jgi:hypothetical protein
MTAHAAMRPTHNETPSEVTGATGFGTMFDWVMAAVSGWLVGGFWLDGWAHVFVPTLETFFTPWHGVLYSGLLAMFAVLIVAWTRGRAAGCPASATLPVGYGLSLVGALLFAAGGVGDMLWHLIFGIEADVEALLSPTHLLLALGAGLMVGGPLRAAWCRPRQEASSGWAELAPMVLSLGFTLSLLAGFMDYANPFGAPWPGTAPIVDWARAAGVSDLRPAVPTPTGQGLGLASILLQAGLLTGAALVALRRWELPVGALTLLFTVAIGLLAAAHEQFLFIPVAVVGGLLADLLLAQLRPSAERRRALRAFAFAVPAALFAAYFLALGVTEGISWSIPLWTGAILQAGVVGLLLSYVLVPPPVQDGRRTRGAEQ